MFDGFRMHDTAAALSSVRSRSARTLLALAAGGLFTFIGLQPLQSTLDDLRFRMLSRPPSGRLLLVDIDAPSLQALGPWPWPRTVHARILDRLVALGAAEIAFDIDFSSPSRDDDDASFERALQRADGSVMLAALKQVVGLDAAGRKVILDTRPLERFAAHTWEASVNVEPDRDGRVRWHSQGDVFRYRDPARPGGEPLLSLASVIGEGAGRVGERFLVDYGVDADRFAHLSVMDLLSQDGAKDRALGQEVRGRKVIVGASAVELRDFFLVPRFGLLNGPLVQALATESLLQRRSLQRPPMWLTVVGTLGVLGACGIASSLLPLMWVIASSVLVGAVVEAAAAGLQWFLPIDPVTAPIHAGLLCLAGLTVATEVHERRLKLQASRNRADALRRILDRVIADNFAGIVVVDRAGTIRAVSNAAQSLIGCSGGTGPDQTFATYLPVPLADLVRQAMVEAEAGAVTRLSTEVSCDLPGSASAVLDCVATVSWPGASISSDQQGPGNFVICLTFRDVTEQRRAQAQIVRMARTDALSGLNNRYVLLERLSVSDPRSDGACIALALFDLDRFKIINSRFGETAGDQLIRALAVRLREAMSPGDVAARLGGDRFGLAFNSPSARASRAMAERLRTTLGGIYEILDYTIQVSLSVGLAVHDGQSADELMRDAEAALHVAKREGGGCTYEFDAEIERQVNDAKVLEAELREALHQEAFSVVYQKQVDAHTAQVVGVEALVRWTCPGRGPVSPALFIPAAERTGLIKPLGSWVLRTACQDAVTWPVPIKVSVNLSAVQLAQADLADQVLDVLAETKLPAERLDLELTESLLMEDGEAIRATLDRLRTAGIRISLDDFGTGYSSLSYLKDFPVNKIKIDQSFVRALSRDQTASAIIRAVAQLARDLGLRVNVEGVETPEEMSLLRLLGCDEIQGYLHGRPEGSDAISAFLRRQAANDGREALKRSNGQLW